ncbi:uncharacterized protein G2W53_018315 [Senna tora]|uniref:Uncharacterized protein n=1 Tax=Senna tora TaxID=362788 RepID=A0A834WPR0_9FABA|nr:uncharacterized protein G2W53_018315 [Senna tora]
MARIPCRRVLSRHGGFNHGGFRAQSPSESSPLPSLSIDSRALSTDSTMARGMDSISEESLRSFIDDHPVIDLGKVTYESPAYHPEEEHFFATSGRERELFFHYDESIVYRDLSERVRVIGVIPPFSGFTMSFLNCINVGSVQLVPNVWVYPRGFEKACAAAGKKNKTTAKNLAEPLGLLAFRGAATFSPSTLAAFTDSRGGIAPIFISQLKLPVLLFLPCLDLHTKNLIRVIRTTGSKERILKLQLPSSIEVRKLNQRKTMLKDNTTPLAAAPQASNVACALSSST